MARLPDLLEFAAEHGLKVGTIADLIAYRSQTERLVERAAERTVQTPYGAFVLPEPEGPTNATVSPRVTPNDTCRIAGRSTEG